jgi:glycosyltransferase involved in cell wall biosynthesis
LKVIIANDHLYPDGGADVVALSSAEGLAQLGVDVTFFAADLRKSDDFALRPYRVVCTGQQDLAGDPNRLRAARQGLWNSVATSHLQRLLLDFEPSSTIIHVHSWTKALSSGVFRACWRAGFKVVCTLHDYFSVCPNGTLFNSQTRQICALTPMSVACIAAHCDPRAYAHKLYRVARHVIQEHISGLARNVDQFITVSAFSERVLAQHLPLDCRFVKVRNPIDVGERATPADPAASNSFVMVGRMFPPKGWDMFLSACERAGVQAIAVGDGIDRESLQRRYASARFVGHLDRQGVVEAVRSARALILPSMWYETQGLVIDEAAAQGVPSIVADGCGGAENIDPDRSGMLFEQGNIDALVAKIRLLAENPALARRMGRAAWELFWSDPPTPAAHARALVSVYEQVLAGGAAQLRSSSTAHARPTIVNS